MAKKLTAVEQTWYRPFIADLFSAGGRITFGVRSYYNNWISYYSHTKDAAAIICNEIKNRNFDFTTADAALETLTSAAVYPLHNPGSGKKLTSMQMANIIAAFCAEHEILWDDINTTRTTTEMDTYRMSVLGKACWNFECFLSQNLAKKDAKTRAAATRTIDPATGKVAPKNPYKTSGPKSGVIGGLIGEPGEKIKFSTSDNLFVVLCKADKPKKQYIFVDPVAYKADVNKVRFGDPSGYSTCKLVFDSYAAAEEAIERIEAYSLRVPVDITGFEIIRHKVDPNGYFNIKTEIGSAYIQASKLNEAIMEACASEQESAEASWISDVDIYTEAFIDHV
jgi:hypothetical protein